MKKTLCLLLMMGLLCLMAGCSGADYDRLSGEILVKLGDREPPIHTTGEGSVVDELAETTEDASLESTDESAAHEAVDAS